MTTRMMSDEMSAEVDDFLAHYGVKGMRWGHRKAAPSTEDIKGARTRLAGQHVKMETKRQEVKRLKKAGSSSKRAENDLMNMELKFLKDPDRVTAARLTKGEKWIVGTVGVLGGPVGLAVAGANAGGTAAARKTIERRQASGYYDAKYSKKRAK